MLRRIAGPIAFWGAAIGTGALIGALLTWRTLGAFGDIALERYGQWRHNPHAGSSAADPYTRAAIARTGLLALSARESVYFTLAEDERGARLDEACVYELRGGALPARWWSITLYAPDGYLPRNSDHAFSVDATRLGEGDWAARVGPVRGDAAHWISSRAAQRGFVLTLRLYQPQQSARESPGALPLPQLRRLSCPGEP